MKKYQTELCIIIISQMKLNNIIDKKKQYMYVYIENIAFEAKICTDILISSDKNILGILFK